MSKTSKKEASAARKARVEEMRRAEKARERRSRIITITLSTVIVAGLVGWGGYALNSSNEKSEQQAAEAKKPVQGEKTWEAKKLTRNHVQGTVKYAMSPPVGGDHSQAWMTCDGSVYTEAIPNENASTRSSTAQSGSPTTTRPPTPTSRLSGTRFPRPRTA